MANPTSPLSILGAVQNVLGGGSGGGGLFAAAGRGTFNPISSVAGDYGLGRLLNRRRPSNFLMMRKKRKPQSLEEMQMMQGGMGADESAP